MWRCVVSGCPNRMGSVSRGALKRGPKRFFRFPTSPDRVKVWLAALRETDKDPSEQYFICEDHFLPEDISGNDIRSDAIPIMPPYLDGPQFPTGADPLLEEEQWATGGWGEEEEEEDEDEPGSVGAVPSPGTPLTRLTQGFLQLLMADPDASLDVREAAEKLQTHTHRVQSVVDVLHGVGLVQSDSDERVRWIGSSPIFSFLWRDTLSFLTMLQGLKDMEEEVDRLFKSCAQQLFDLTEDEENSSYPSESPPETKLVIPPPDEDGIRMQLKSENGPIMALTCDMGTLTSELTNSRMAFSALESRVRACTLDEGTWNRKVWNISITFLRLIRVTLIYPSFEG
uniref:THAP domain-containing protein 1 n=1 Tax=Poecilia reticulata TaxID=8081 RepID=A0A3P9PI34_POERE